MKTARYFWFCFRNRFSNAIRENRNKNVMRPMSKTTLLLVYFTRVNLQCGRSVLIFTRIVRRQYRHCPNRKRVSRFSYSRNRKLARKRERYYVQRKAISRLLFVFYSFYGDFGTKSVSDLENDRYSYASFGRGYCISFAYAFITRI